MTEPFIATVDEHLSLRGRARTQALADLRDILADVDPAELGDPREYAHTVNEQFGELTSTVGRFAPPVALFAGIGKRMAGTFDPADERILVPRVFGIGWAVNMGRIAVLLGLLRPDDVDNEILDEAVSDLGSAQIAASLAVALAAGSVASLAARGSKPQSPTPSLVFGTLLPVLSAALIAGSTSSELPAAQRLTMPAIAASLATMSAGICAQEATNPEGKAWAVAGTALAVPLQLALSYLPVRAALRRRWNTLGGTHA